MVKDSWPKLVIAMGCMVVISATTAATAYLIKPVLDDIFVDKDVQMLKLIPIAVILLYIVRSLAMFGQQYLMSYIGQNIIRRLRNDLYSRIQDLPLAFFQEEKTGGLMSRITYDVNIVKNMVSGTVTGSTKDCFTVIGLIFVIFYQIWQLALIAFVVLPLAFFPVVALGRCVRRVSTGCQESMAEMNSFLHETLAGNKIVKAFGREDYEKKRFFDRSLSLFKLEMKEVIARSLSGPINEILAGIGIAFIIWYGGYHVIAGTYTTGTFVSFLAAVLMLYEPVKKLSKLNNAVQQGLAATDRIFDILERQSDIREAPNPITYPNRPHRVTFDRVFFRYEHDMVLKGIHLDVQPGEILALVGTSGGGKTSLVNLIPRFYDVTEGAIRIDGIDIRQASIASLRQQIAIVTQEPILFNDTVKNNIAYGNSHASDAEIKKAAQAAYAYEFIQSFPQGFGTRIGELGGRLSGGQKQRICIARALLKDAPILILDEATSSLDTESETLVQKALENLMEGRTTFVIAHRLSTISHADRIVVLVDGQIVEEGQHDELLACEGEYCKLYRMQFSNGFNEKAAGLGP
ncbi:MAG: ABC transporter ATP-binding protein [Desulfobacterales bacterium]|nr:MAG: ABC transporter ATP-binding protein [Desulfobacterales bacterium]